jgi:hypothetical protein
MIRFFFFVLVLTFLTSCRAYRIYPAEHREFSYGQTKRPAFVINPELSKEYAILKEAAVFNLVSDSLSSAVIKIELLPMEKRLASGNDVFITLFTVGQFPVLYSDLYYYKFEEVTEEKKVSKAFELQVATSVWFWNMFSSKKDFNKQAGQALLASY